MTEPTLRLTEQVYVAHLEDYILEVNKEGWYVSKGWQNPINPKVMFLEVVFTKPESEYKPLTKKKVIYEMQRED